MEIENRRKPHNHERSHSRHSHQAHEKSHHLASDKRSHEYTRSKPYYRPDKSRRSRSRSRQRSNSTDRKRDSRRALERRKETEKSRSRQRSNSTDRKRDSRRSLERRKETEQSRSRQKDERRNDTQKADRSKSRSKERKNDIGSRLLGPEQRLDVLKKELCFMLQDDAPRKQYSRTQDWNKKKDIIHWGQRKLFLSELWFLTKYGHLATCVVYAGSAPGTHITFLAKLFPQHHFILIDPSNFELKVLQNDSTNARERIVTRQEYFTDELATQLAQEHQDNILFISDIRTADPKQQDHELVEIMVAKDNMKQKDWINIMKPKKSLLKFRCPYPDRQNGRENLKMFKGEIYIQPYAAPTSTETRLVPDDSLEEIEYDNLKYEQQLYYHNHVPRKMDYPQPIKRGEGFNQTWDLSVEVALLYDFLMKFPEQYNNLHIFERIIKFSYDISRNCTLTSRNLTTRMVRPELRRRHSSKNHLELFYPDLAKNGLSEAELAQIEKENQEQE